MTKAAPSLLYALALASVCSAHPWLLPDIRYAEREPKLPNALFFKNAHVLVGGKTQVWLRVAGPSSRLVVYDGQGRKVRERSVPKGEAWASFDASRLTPGKYGARIEEKSVSLAEGAFWVHRVNTAKRERVPLYIDEPIGTEQEAFPVRVGVPFSPGVIDSTDSMRVVDDQGREVPAQFEVTAYCTPEKQDLRWVLVSFFASARQYCLEYGSEVRHQPAAQVLKVEDTEPAVAVDTGVIRFSVDKTTGALLRDLCHGDVPVLSSGGLFVQNQDRASFSSRSDRPEVAVEEAGPLSCAIALRGWYRNEAGQKFCRYVVRIHAFAGKPYLKLYHTWIFTEDSRTTKIGDISLRLAFGGSASRGAFGTDPDYKKPPHAVALRDSVVSLIQEDSDAFSIKRGTRTLSQGRRAGGWCAAWTPKAGVLLHLRDMWEMYPNELEIRPNSMAVHFWPEHGFSYTHKQHGIGRHRWPLSDGPIMDLQPREWVEQTMKTDREFVYGHDHINAKGVARTHELWLLVTPPDTTPSHVQGQAALFEKPLAGRADPRWISATGVFRPFLPYSPDVHPEIETSIEARWQAVFHNQALAHNYGWLFWGNQQTYNYITPDKNGKKPSFRGPYVIPAHESITTPDGKGPYFKRIHRYWKGLAYRSGMEPWLLWLRTGKREYFDFAEALTRQIEDIYIANHDRWDLSARCRGKEGYRYTCCFIPYNSNCDPDGSHMDAIGHSRMSYYLTGFRRSCDVVDMVGASMLDYNFRTSMPLSRTLMGTAHNMFEAYHMTHNEKYWDAVWPGINRVLDSTAHCALGHSTLNYFWELYYDWYSLHGDRRVEAGLGAVLNVHKRKPLGERSTYPLAFCFGHLYELTGDREYLAYGLGDLIHTFYCANRTSADPNYYGQKGYGDPVSFTRTIRQTPGLLHYLHQAQQNGKIRPRFRPICFHGDPRVITGAYRKNPPNRGPVYLLDEHDTAFDVKLYFTFWTRMAMDIQIKASLHAPNGRVVASREAERRCFTTGNINAGKHLPYFRFSVPADGQKGQYTLTFDFEPTDIGNEYYQWGVECAELPKVAYGMRKFRYSGVAFFQMPENRGDLKLVMTPDSGYKGDLVVIDPQGTVVRRLSGQRGPVALPADDGLEPGQMYGVVGGPELEFIAGVAAVFSNADAYFPVDVR